MAHEIERKYLVDTSLWRPAGPGVLYRQGYLSSAIDRVVRIRIAGDQAFLTIKGANEGISRLEFEYPMPVADAAEMLDKLAQKPLIEKTRHREAYAGRDWEIDVFHGDNEGLVLAEVELPDVDATVSPPPWVLAEVSDDPRYYNSNLVANPYKRWRTDGG